jgi:2-methylfumaryl-CoA isomerase
MYGLLNGLRIVEGAAFIAGPSCGLYLAQFGAEVVRFDQIGGGPDSKRWPLAENGASQYWEGLNKGKKSVAIDLARPQGRELAQRLATSGDGLFVTNYPVEGFLSYAKLAALRANLICLRVMGWADGTPAVDYTVNAAVGVPLMTGPADSQTPVNHVLPAWDLLAGAYAAFALLAAERDRQKTGKGREIRLALSDIAAATMGNLGNIAEVLAQQADRPRSGNDLFGAFGRDFTTRDNKRLMVVAITRRQWEKLLEVLDLTAQIAAIEADYRLSFAADEGARFTHRHALNPLFEAAFAARDAATLAPLFDAQGVCWSQYQSLAEAVAGDSRLFTANEIFAPVTHPSGTYPTPGSAARLPQDTRAAAAPSPRLGADTDEILASWLGMSEHEIGTLHDRGLVA